MIRDLEASEADEIERERELEGTQLGEPRRKLNCRVDLDWIGLDWIGIGIHGWIWYGVGGYLDGAALGVVLVALVEVGHVAEAAAAVLDEGADGGAPPPLRLLRRVLGRQLEVLLQIPLHLLPSFLLSLVRREY